MEYEEPTKKTKEIFGEKFFRDAVIRQIIEGSDSDLRLNFDLITGIESPRKDYRLRTVWVKIKDIISLKMN